MQKLAHYAPLFPVSAEVRATFGQLVETTQFPYNYPDILSK